MPSAYAWYRAGTASVTNGSPSVTGTSTAWIANAAEGDGISFDGGSTWYEVASVTNNTTLTLSTSYAGATASGLTYAIDRRSTRRSMTSELYQVVSNLIQSAVRLYSTTGVPSNSIGSDGSLAFDSTAEKFYQKSAGSWDAGTSFRGSPGAAASVAVGSTTTLPSGSSAAVSNSGTSSAAVLEFSIPMGLTGATGATGATGPAAWTTIAAWAATTAYTVGPPASVVTFGGETYVCTTSHTSTASFDPTKFTKVAAKGLDGAIASVSGGTTGLTFDTPNSNPTITGTLGPANGGTGKSVFAIGQFLFATAANVWDAITLSGDVSVSNTGAVTIADNAVNLAGAKVTGTLPGANGGTGSGFLEFTGLTTTLKTFTLPDVTGLTLAALNYVQAWTRAQYFQPATLTDAATITWDGDTQQVSRVVLGGNRAIAAMSNPREGAYYEVALVQDATGSRVPTWASTGPGSYSFGAQGIPALSSAAGSVDLLGFRAVTVAGSLRLCFVGISRGHI